MRNIKKSLIGLVLLGGILSLSFLSIASNSWRKSHAFEKLTEVLELPFKSPKSIQSETAEPMRINTACTPNINYNGFQILSEGNFSFTGSTHVHGALGVGGNLIINTAAASEINMDNVGTYIFPGDGTTSTGLLVKGSVTWTNGFTKVLNSKYIHIGNSTGSASGDNGTNSATQVYPSGTSYNNAKRIEGTTDQTPSPAVFQSGGLDIAALFTDYRNFSQTIAANTNNVQLKNAAGTNISGNNVTSAQNVKITSLANGINYLNLTTTSLNNFTEFKFEGTSPTASKILVINVQLTSNFVWNNVNMPSLSGSANGAYILWNFYGTTTYNLTINQPSLIIGTIFAPKHNLTKVGTNDIEGNLVAKTITLGTGEIHYYPFTATLITCPTGEICGNGIDDDGDGLTDCADPECYLAINSGDTDSDGDGIGDGCDLDDDNDGILDIEECPVPTNSGLNGPLSFTFNISTTDASSSSVPHILNSITYGGTTYTDFIVPDSYTSAFSLVNPTGVALTKNGSTVFNYSSNPNYDQDIIVDAFQSRNLNAYQALDWNNFADGDYYILGYNNPIVSTAGGFIAVTERLGNNPQVLQALDINGNVVGTTLNVQTSHYVDLGVNVLPGGNQHSFMALYPVDDLAPVGTQIYGLKVSFGATATNDGPDAKAFFFGDIALFTCDYDGDGIPNNLDLDSDNDGCSDALEGSANFTVTDLLANRLIGSIENNGIPSIAGTGQSLGQSQNSTITSCIEICNNGIDDNGDGLVDCLDCDNCYSSGHCADSDGDGIGDYCDLDDDNDGIPDLVESNLVEVCTSTSIGGTTFPSYNYTNCNSVSGGKLFSNIGTFQGVNIDMKILDEPGTTLNCGLTGNLGCNSADQGFTINSTNNGNDLQISFFESGTSNPVAINWAVFMDDFDLDEGIAVLKSNLLSYVLNANNNTTITDLGTELNFYSGNNNQDELLLYFKDVQSITFRFTHGISNRAICFASATGYFPNNPVCSFYQIIGDDTDGDGIFNHLDLDSDNDGIYDIDEAGHNAPDANNDGVIDGTSSLFGSNGLFNNIETSVDSDVINYTIKDSENTPDGKFDAYELDSDNDGCFDTREALVSDSDFNGIAGTGGPTTTSTGLVVGFSYPFPATTEWRNSTLKSGCAEICNNGIDDDSDGLTDCADPNCGTISITNVSVGTCINHPYADISTLNVTVSWQSGTPNKIIEVSIAGKTEYIDVPNGATSPATVSFVVPANGSTGNTITAKFKTYTCQATATYNAAAACSNDGLSCSMLYICGDSKGGDADAFDHGLMQYIDGINGNAILKAALSKNVAGQGLYDPNNSSTLTPYNIDTFDIILVSATTWGQISSTLKTQLKNTGANVLLLNHDILVNLAMASYQGYLTQNYAYSDNTTQVQIYNFNNSDPHWDELMGKGDYHITTADGYLWGIANAQSSGLKGIYFHYTSTDVLGGVPSTHGGRTFLGYMMDGVYWNNSTNMGAMPVPQAEWFDPIRHLTQAGKLYLDQAIQKAAIGCSNENCSNGIDDDGDGAIDCDDADCAAGCPLPELEFCTYNLKLDYNETFNIRDFVHVKNGSGPVDWSQVYFTYTLAGANDPTNPTNWNLTNFNNGVNVTVTAADAASGTGNSGDGRYRIYIVRNGETDYDDHMEIRIEDGSSNSFSAKCEPIDEICNDGIDNDGDGIIDCDDPNCKVSPPSSIDID